MHAPVSAMALDKFATFGDLLRYLRRRVGLTQRELSIAVGYSDAQISRLEQNQRLPDLPTIAARFVSALDLEHESEAVTRLMELAAAVSREDAPTLGLSPFKGLLYYDEADADLFFGRELLIERLTERLIDAAATGERFLAIVGASGSGKSSVVRAGLVPSLRWRSSSANWPMHVITPSAHPLESIAMSLSSAAESLRTTISLADDLAHDARTLHVAVKRTAERAQSSHALIVVDQLEEVFTLCRSQQERQAFVDSLLAAAYEPDGPAIVVVALRADFYAHCADFASLRQALAHDQEYIGRMTVEELRRAIEEPARRGNWEFEPGLVDLLLRDVGEEPGALPLLSHALLETWQRRRGRALTLSGYLASGGVRGAIAETAEAVFQDQLDRKERAIARQIFLRLTELGEGTQDTRRRAQLVEFVARPEDAPAVEDVVKTLADARLITTSEGTAEVAHEALIREWPTLREWLAEDRDGLRLHRHLTEAAQEWDALNRDPDLLYRGARLAQAVEWAAAHGEDFNTLEQSFLDVSQEQVKREVAEREAQRQRELAAAQQLAETEKRHAQEHAQAAKRLRGRAVFLTAALVVVGILAVTALAFGLQAGQESRLATSRELAAAAIESLEFDPERSVLLALHAASTANTSEAENALHRSILTSRVQLTLRGYPTGVGVSAVAFSSDGSLVATSSWDGPTIVWDATTGEELRTLGSSNEAGFNNVAFSPDGTRLATAGGDRIARLWDAKSGEELLTFSGHSDNITSVAFSPDGSRLATASVDTTAIVWDTATGRKLLTLSGHGDGVASVSFSPQEDRLATASFDGTVKIWDAASGEEVRAFPGYYAIFSPDGMRLATVGGGDANPPTVWSLASGEELVRLYGHTNRIDFITFSPDGTMLATSGLDQTAIVWDATSGLELMTLAGHEEPVGSVAFGPDGTRLATASADGTARIWSLSPSHEALTIFHKPERFVAGRFALSPDGTRLVTVNELDASATVWRVHTGTGSGGSADSAEELFTLEGHTEYVRGLTFSPDGSRIGTASYDGTAVVWDAATGRPLLTLSGHEGFVSYVAFSPDGSRIATGGFDHTAKVWDALSGKELLTLAGHTGRVAIATFSSDGTRIATGADDGTAKIWDAATGKEILTVEHSYTVYGVAFSPDGSRLATATDFGTAMVWDAVSGEELLALTSHNGTIVTVVFSPDGTRLATASLDGTAKVWEVQSGREQLTLYGSGVGVGMVAFSPDGTRLYTGGADGVRSYALRLDDLTAIARSRVTRSLTNEECQKYLHVELCPSIP